MIRSRAISRSAAPASKRGMQTKVPSTSAIASNERTPRAIEKKLTDDDARPILFYPRAANCYYPKVKGLVTQANSIYNGQRFEDLWLDN